MDGRPETFAALRATTSDSPALATAARACLASRDVVAVARETARLLDLLAGPPERYEALRAFLGAAEEAACSRTA